MFVLKAGKILTLFFSVVQKFRITAPDGIDLELYNSKRAPIDFEVLPILVKQHKNDPNFFIEVRADKPGVYIQQSEVNNCRTLLWAIIKINSIHISFRT